MILTQHRYKRLPQGIAIINNEIKSLAIKTTKYKTSEKTSKQYSYKIELINDKKANYNKKIKPILGLNQNQYHIKPLILSTGLSKNQIQKHLIHDTQSFFKNHPTFNLIDFTIIKNKKNPKKKCLIIACDKNVMQEAITLCHNHNLYPSVATVDILSFCYLTSTIEQKRTHAGLTYIGNTLTFYHVKKGYIVDFIQTQIQPQNSTKTSSEQPAQQQLVSFINTHVSQKFSDFSIPIYWYSDTIMRPDNSWQTPTLINVRDHHLIPLDHKEPHENYLALATATQGFYRANY